MKTITNGLLLRKTPRGDADLIISAFTESLGVVSAVAYSARKSKRRFACLEPYHTLRFELDDVAGRDLAVLANATLVEPRLPFTESLARMEQGGEALRWTREMSPPRQPEPELWTALAGALDQLALSDEPDPLAVYGLTMLRVLGVPPISGVRQGMRAGEIIGVVRRTVREHTAR